MTNAGVPRTGCGSARTAGFSLLELLVVVVIIGILASMFTLSIGLTGGDRAVEKEIDRMRALLAVASDDAIMQGRELGLYFYRGGYEFMELDPEENRWVTLAADPVLRRREFGADLKMALEIEGRDVELDDKPEEASAKQPQESAEDEDEKQDERDAPRPQVFVFSSGDIAPPFGLRLRREFGNLTLLLDVDSDGSTGITREEF